MKRNMNIFFLLFIGCLPLRASQAAVAAWATQSTIQDDDDWYFLSDNVNPVSKILWKNTALSVVAQLRLAKIATLQAENQLKDAQIKELQDKLAGEKGNAELWQKISYEKSEKLRYINGKHNGYKKTSIQQFAVLREQNQKLKIELNRVKAYYKRMLIKVHKTNSDSLQATLKSFGHRMNMDWMATLKESELNLLRQTSCI